MGGEGEKWSFAFTQTKVTVKAADLEIYQGKYYTNDSKIPNQANFRVIRSSIPQYEGKTCLVIYEIDGNSLRIAAACRLRYCSIDYGIVRFSTFTYPDEKYVTVLSNSFIIWRI